MRRREFLMGLGAAAWPLIARAQQRTQLIGYLSLTSPGNLPDVWASFHEGLKEAGFVEGRNVKIEYRSADGHFDRLPAFAVDLVNRGVAVIYATGGLSPAIAAKAATATIPIVFQGGGDPVQLGLVASLNRPGGNVTGANNMSSGALDAKAVQYLRALVPTAPLLGLLVNSGGVTNITTEARTAAQQLNWEFRVFEASTDEQLATSFEAMAQQGIGGLHVAGDAFFTSRRGQIVALAAKYAIPASYSLREFVIAGGLMSYGPDLRESNRVAGTYVGRILKGEKPADLPVQQSVKVQLAINLKTAKALGLTFPLTLLGRADEVIE